MKNIFMLTSSNLRKNKSQAVTMLLLILVTVMLINIGLVMYLRMTEFFDKRAEELNTPHFMSLRVSEEAADEHFQFVKNHPSVAEAEQIHVLFGSGSILINDSSYHGVLIVSPIDESQKMNPALTIGESLPLTSDSIYIPHFMTLDAGVTVGDTAKITFGDEELNFYIAGGTEEIMFGAMFSSIWRVYVSDEVFDNLRLRMPESVSAQIGARLNPGEQHFALSTAYWDEFVGESNFFLTTPSQARSSRTMVPTIAAMLILIFAIILLVVGVIVIRFRIINSIDESMVNIGVLKAIGFVNNQIIASIVLMFGLITFLGGTVGIFAAQIVFSPIVRLIEPFFGLNWRPAFDIPLMLISLIAVLVVVILFSYISSIKIKKLHPLVALRNGVSTHNFKRNFFPLEKTKSALIFLLSLKSLFMNKKQGFMVCLIIAALSFTSVSGLAIHYNINVNHDAFIRTISGEIHDIIFILTDGEYLEDFRAEIESMDAVKSTAVGGSGNAVTSLVVNDRTLTFTIVYDFSDLAGYELVEGRFPIHANEIAVGANALQNMGASVGDFITVLGHDRETEETFIVTGSTQSMNHSGMVSIEALERVNIEIVLSTVNVNILPSYDIQEVIDLVLENNGEIISNVLKMDELSESQMGPIGDIFSMVTAALLVVVSGVVVLVLYLIIKTTIIRKHREIGIQKAIGFTTFELMNQISLILTPTIIIGSVIGSAAGYLGFDAIFVMLLRGQGIASANLPVPLFWTIVICLLFIIFSYVVSMMITWRIRKITAYSLLLD